MAFSHEKLLMQLAIENLTQLGYVAGDSEFAKSSNAFYPGLSEITSLMKLDQMPVVECPSTNVLDKVPHKENPVSSFNQSVSKKRLKEQLELCKRNINKSKRRLRQENLKGNGVSVEEKKPKREDCSKCRYNCSSNFDYEIQVRLCKEYWNLGDSDKQKFYLSSLVDNVPVHRKSVITVTKNRSTSRIFYLRNALGEKKRVCLKFFCGTFAISHKVLKLTMKTMDFRKIFSGNDSETPESSSDFSPDLSEIASSTKHDQMPIVECPDINVVDKVLHKENPISSFDQPVIKKRQKGGQPELSKRNINKNKRRFGQEYVNGHGVLVKEKKPKREDCSKCRYKCNANFDYEMQVKLCKEYWNLGNSDKQKLYLSCLIDNVPVSRKTVTKVTTNRSTSRIFYLQNAAKEKKRVCLKFFCGTFAISHKVVELTMKSVGVGGVYIGQNRRFGVRPSNATPEDSVAFVKKHIESFLTYDSHNCKKDSNKAYFDCSLNVTTMFRFYNELCVSEGKRPVSCFVYRKIFHKSFNQYSFSSSSKEQCIDCNIDKNAADKTPLSQEQNECKK